MKSKGSKTPSLSLWSLGSKNFEPELEPLLKSHSLSLNLKPRA